MFAKNVSKNHFIARPTERFGVDRLRLNNQQRMSAFGVVSFEFEARVRVRVGPPSQQLPYGAEVPSKRET